MTLTPRHEPPPEQTDCRQSADILFRPCALANPKAHTGTHRRTRISALRRRGGFFGWEHRERIHCRTDHLVDRIVSHAIMPL
jgi:hypothetical protein